MLNIGYHESSSGGFSSMLDEALEAGANTFAFFTRNPRALFNSKSKPFDGADIEIFKESAKTNNFAPIVAHAPYTMNPCSAREEIRRLALSLIKSDLEIMRNIPNNFYNFHPGSHLGAGVTEGVTHTARMLSLLFEDFLSREEQFSTTVLIETMSGKGSEIGKTFSEIKSIIDKTEEFLGKSTSEFLGVCLDTCHIWDAGYDIKSNLSGVLDEFDATVGLSRLKAIHLNDSKNVLSSHKDRHELIGLGYIGKEALLEVVNNSRLQGLPFILETPNDKEGYAREIAFFRENYTLS